MTQVSCGCRSGLTSSSSGYPGPSPTILQLLLGSEGEGSCGGRGHPGGKSTCVQLIIQAPGVAMSLTQDTGLHHLSPLLHSRPAPPTHHAPSSWAGDMKSISGKEKENYYGAGVIQKREGLSLERSTTLRHLPILQAQRQSNICKRRAILFFGRQYTIICPCRRRYSFIALLSKARVSQPRHIDTRRSLCCGRFPVHCRAFGSISDLCPLDANRTP